MSVLYLTVRGQNVIPSVPNIIVSDTINYLSVSLTADSEWDGLNKWVHFVSATKNYEIQLTNNVANGINLPTGDYEVYLHGSTTTKRITTNKCNVHVEAYPGNGEFIPAIAPTTAEQIAYNAEQAKLIAQSVRDDADAGEFKGDKGDKGEKGDPGNDGTSYTESAEFKALAAEIEANATQVSNNTATVTNALTSVLASENRIKNSENTAVNSAQSAQTAKTGAESAKASADASVLDARQSATNASNYAEQSKGYSLQAKGYCDRAESAAEVVSNVNVDGSKVGDTATLTLTQKDGTVKTVTIKDGKDGADGAPGADGKDYVITEADYTAIGAKVEAEYTPELSSINQSLTQLSSDVDDLETAVIDGNPITEITKIPMTLGYGNGAGDTRKRICHSEAWDISDADGRIVYFDSDKYYLDVYGFSKLDSYKKPKQSIKVSPVDISRGVGISNYKTLGVELITLDNTAIDLDYASDTTYYSNTTETQIGKNKSNISNHETRISTLETTVENIENPSLILPKNFYAVVGHEFVVYYDNLLKCYEPKEFVVTTECDSKLLAFYPEFDNCFKFTPNSNAIGEYTITFKVIRKRTWTVATTGTVKLIIKADTQFATEKKIMCIGDSLTYRGLYQAELEHMNNIKSIGTIERSIGYNSSYWTGKIEGRNGWASYDYADKSSFTQFSNPFYNPSTQHFDFGYYMSNNNVDVPDVVFINLGTNGGNGYAINNVINGLDTMIASIKAYNATIPIVIHIYPTASRAGNTSRGTYKRTVWSDKDSRIDYYNCIAQYITKYDETDSQVHLVPVYHFLDPVYDFQRETVSVSARNSEQITIGANDGTHPADSGYLHMADAYYNWLICNLT